MKLVVCIAAALLCAASLPAAYALPREPGTDISVHDPTMIKQGTTCYVFSTGHGLPMFSSTDLVHWKADGSVFTDPPTWIPAAVPGFSGGLWAPDVSFYQGQFYLYYAASAFGRNASCIGVATNVTLDRDDPRYGWIDHGRVLQSQPGRSNWNAIDPNLITDNAGRPYLFFGSFWGGLSVVALTPDRLHVAGDLTTLPTIASRSKAFNVTLDPPPSGGYPGGAGLNAIEAPFVFRRGDYFYLTASIDYCCRGAASTYKMIIGRAREVLGPYLDKAGLPLAAGGGTILLMGNKDWYGVGHNAVTEINGRFYLVFHGYDAADQARSKLRIEPLYWDAQGWPSVGLNAH